MTECLTYNISVTPAHARFGLANPKHLPDLAIRQERRTEKHLPDLAIRQERRTEKHLPDLAIRQERRTEKHLPDLPIRQEQEVGRLFGHGYSAVLVPKG